MCYLNTGQRDMTLHIMNYVYELFRLVGNELYYNEESTTTLYNIC